MLTLCLAIQRHHLPSTHPPPRASLRRRLPCHALAPSPLPQPLAASPHFPSACRQVRDVSGLTRFTWSVDFKGTPLVDPLTPPQPIDCTASDVDQIEGRVAAWGTPRLPPATGGLLPGVSRGCRLQGAGCCLGYPEVAACQGKHLIPDTPRAPSQGHVGRVCARLFLEPDAVSRVLLVHFNGEEVDFYKDSDTYKTWIQVINLYWTNTTAPGVLDVFVEGVITLPEVSAGAVLVAWEYP
eukprot:356052-Chlamydomonas_euryale.AAC.2